MARLTPPSPGWLSLCALVASAAACAKARPDVTGTPRCVSWKEEIGPLFTQRCASCHTGTAPAGSYDTGSYLGVLANGSDTTPNAQAGDAGSQLLTALDPTSADSVHQSLAPADFFPEVRSWVVDCALSYVPSSIHRAGILDPASGDFHGRLIQSQGFKLDNCQGCHGQDFSGGTSGVSCLTCHADGPTACATCHSEISSSGSHGRHIAGGPLGKTYGCGECHVVPTKYTDVGHIFLADGSLDPPPAEVTFGATAALTPVGSARVAPPSFDPATKTCSNVYCHGAISTLADTTASNPAPVWTAPGTGQADCGSCHGLPPNHVGTRACVACHPSVVGGDGSIIATALHIDGKIELADPAAGCIGCHGGLAGPAPPRDLTGAAAPSSPGVGAHQAHLGAGAHLRGPIACTECHLVPTDVSSAGHFSGHGSADADPIDGAEVFPTEPGVAVLASTDGAVPHYDRPTATCSNVYCHGGGIALAADTTVGVNHAPVWTATGGLGCGAACHGSPPAFSPHLPTMTRLDCSSCHPRTVDPSGVVIISGPPGAETSAHINGVLDVAE